MIQACRAPVEIVLSLAGLGLGFTIKVSHTDAKSATPIKMYEADGLPVAPFR
jgi:hypothetical protein